MASASRFEDLIVWQKARLLATMVYELTGRGPIASTHSLRDQMRSAALSVVSNIAEGYERYGRRDFARCVGIAKGSAGELRAQALVATDLRLLPEADGQELLRRCHEVSRLLTNLRRALERPRRESPG
jgi:four helix bundle protein